ncbi:hypothetical protein KXW61_008623 [Aspergillus fumigatus]|nr:hypothetical protein KXW61_008623 [Aspergillus fumigatus]
MTHPYYPSGDEIGLDQQSGHEGHSISPSAGPDGQPEMVEKGTSSVSPALEIDGRSRSSTRRRIQVAVNSSMLQTKVTGWPYHASNATVSSSRLGVYAHMAQRSGLVPTNSLGARLGSFSRPSGYDLGTCNPQHPPSRQTFSFDHTANYDNEPTAHNPSSSYMFPSSQQGILPDYCGLAWNSKAWNSNTQVNNAQSGAAFPTQDTENAFASSPYPFLFSGQGTQSTDVPMACTPSDGQGADRTLPKASGRSQLQMGMSSPSATPEAIHKSLDLEWLPSEHAAGLEQELQRQLPEPVKEGKSVKCTRHNVRLSAHNIGRNALASWLLYWYSTQCV